MASVTIKAPALAVLKVRFSGLLPNEVTKALQNGATRTARKYIDFKTARIDEDIDRPHAFTRRAYDYDRARGVDPISARAFVRPKQAEYLYLDEFGGDRYKDGKDRPVSPSADITDRYGGLFGAQGIQNHFLLPSVGKTSKADARKAAGKTGWRMGAVVFFVQKLNTSNGPIGGLWERTKTSSGWKTRLVVKFLDHAVYKPRLHFRADAVTFGEKNFGTNLMEELEKAIKRSLA